MPHRPFRAWLRERGIGMVVLAVVIGAGAGLGAIAFRWLINGATTLFTGHLDYAAAAGQPHSWLPGLGKWFVVLAPVLAGLVYGPLVYRFAREARGHGVPEVMYAVADRGGRIPAQVSLVKALASALCIGSGGSVGREGPIVQIGAALGSALGRFARLTEHRLRILVACGAAAGIAATFNAPLAGPFFAMELILRDFAIESFGAVVLSSVTASVVGRAVMGNEAFLALPSFHLHNPAEFGLFALLGVLVSLGGVLFSKVLYFVEDLCDRVWRGPEWLRPAVGGIPFGLLLLVLPQMYGVGYPVLDHAVAGGYAIGFLLLLMLGKVLATSLTIGIGGSGGVFAPSLFIGAMGGTAFGQLAHLVLPGVAPGAYGLVGMGAAFAGATRAPITGVIVLFELTGEYSIILPLMLAIVVATLVSRAVSRDTIYTAKLSRRGVDLDARHRRGRLPDHPIGRVMEPLPQALPATTSLDAAAGPLARHGYGILPVVDTDGEYQGCVTAQAVAEGLDDDAPEGGEAAVGELVEMPATVTTATSSLDALETLVNAQGTGLPVLTEDGRRLVGWISHQALLSAMRNHAAPRDAVPATMAG